MFPLTPDYDVQQRGERRCIQSCFRWIKYVLQTELEQGFFMVMRHQLPTNENWGKPTAACRYVNSVLLWDTYSALGHIGALVIAAR